MIYRVVRNSVKNIDLSCSILPGEQSSQFHKAGYLTSFWLNYSNLVGTPDISIDSAVDEFELIDIPQQVIPAIDIDAGDFLECLRIQEI